ncbi:MAG: DNA-binding protein WhiA [Veillonella sp.]|nr:DNA-binding protein WhiA [Veillonella sp.]
MSFAEDVKNELCQYEASSDADVAMKIEASCLLRMGGSIILGMKGAVGIRLATANNAVARRLLGILKKQYELPTNVLVRQGLNLRKKNMYTLSVEPSVEGRQALEDLALWPVSEQIPRSWLKSMEARAFLRGAFLGGGSVNKPQSDYHLEFMTGNETFAREIIHVLRLFHIHAGLTERKEEYVVYLKEGDAVTNCLQIMGAQSALMEFENVRIMKTVRNQINRQVNCETANLQKVVDAAVRQVKAIRIIDREIGIEELPEKLRVVARLRWENPEASLKELEELMEGKLSKSGEALALTYDPLGLEEV